MSVHLPILRSLLTAPFREAVVDDARSYRGIEMVVAAANLAREIDRVCDTPTVGVLLPTSGASPIAFLACWMSGRVPVPLNYLLKQDELDVIVEDCGTDTVLAVNLLLDHMGYQPKVPNVLKVDELSLKRVPPVKWPETFGEGDLGTLLYTSGTSGVPKGVELTHGNLAAGVRIARQHIDLSPTGDVFLGVLPQFHCFGLIDLTLLPLTLGCKVVYSARFVPTKIVQKMRDHRPTIMIAIPSMFNALLGMKSAKPEDFASLRLCVSGGEPLPDAVAKKFENRFGVTIAEGYGMTETSAGVNICRPQEYRPHSVGPAMPDVRQRVVCTESGRDLPPGVDGELRVAGPTIMRGYKGRPEETSRAFDERGFLRTGDMARQDTDGHVYITGRLKEMMIVGGENLFPREVEEVVNKAPGVARSACIPRKDPNRGEVPIVFVEMEEDAEFDEAAIRSFARESLAPYKVPREVHRLDAIPLGPTGKVLRRELTPPEAMPSS
ncbi:MAG: AMP-binding protein [Planctomycetota bacterium]